MNKCSAEIVELIIDFACDDLYGNNARMLGLVCKYFREIAEPLEFRTLSISGLAQLDAFSSRVARAMSRPRKMRIEHLFICDYIKKHALWNDTRAKEQHHIPVSKAETFKGRLVASGYRDLNHWFWSSAERLVYIASSTLKTLYLVSFSLSNYKKCNPAEFVYEDSVLSALRGKEFPNLRTLALKHEPEIDTSLSALEDRRWKYPIAPQLKRLRLITHCQLQVRKIPGSEHTYVDYHPLLIGMHKWHPHLQHLHITSSEFTDIEALFKAICKLEGHKGPWYDTSQEAAEEAERDLVRGCLDRRKLPGNLEAVQVNIGRNLAESGLRGTEKSIFTARVANYQNSFARHNMRGLSVVSPTPAFPEKGEREYETLIAEWIDGANTWG